MPTITNTVGAGGANAIHDLTLVQAMLRVIKDKNGHPYFAHAINGVFDSHLTAAIKKFQTEAGLMAALTAGAGPGGGAAGGTAGGGTPAASGGILSTIYRAVITLTHDKPGLAAPLGPTLSGMAAALPSDYATMRVIAGMNVAYLEMDLNASKASSASIAGDTQLDVDFRALVSKLVLNMYERHKIVLTTPPSGRRRTFAQQAALSSTVTGAGPGESNHQFGRAVDIGFQGLRVVGPDSKIHTADYWLNHAGLTGTQQTAFWKARNAIAFDQLGLFPTSFANDLVHIQAYADANISSGKSLATLLTLVGTTHWENFFSAHHNHYRSDLGLGGPKFDAGTAREIFAGTATITKTQIAQARTASGGATVHASAVTDADLTAMKQTLKADFDAADAGWRRWVAVPK